MNHLRVISGRRVGGIIIPFNRRDKHGTTFTRATDLMLDLFRQRPIFLLHNLDAQRVGRAGTLIDSSIEIREEGVYAEAEMAETRIGSLGLDLVAAGRAAWSSGAWPTPNTLQVDNSGFVRRWALAEASICDVTQVSSPPDSVRVVHIRAVTSDEQISSDAVLARSIWLMPETNGNAPVAEDPRPPVVTPPPDATPAPTPGQGNQTVVMSAADLQRVVQNTIDQVMREQPTRSLPNQTQNPVTGGGTQIQVSSEYDNVSLLGMLCYDQLNRMERARHGLSWRRGEKFMRALVDKARVQREDDLKRPGAQPVGGGKVMTVPFRAVTDDVFQQWHSVVPHLRADEAMQSTLATQGDELVPTLLNSTAWYFYRLESKVFGLFEMFDMPSQPYDWPTFTAGMRLRGMAETAHLSQFTIPTSPFKTANIATSKITFSAGMLGIMTLVSQVLFEDGGINVADAVAQYLVRETAASLDDHLLNGDERATSDNISHSADPTGTIYDGYLQFDGLRRIAQAAGDSAAHTTISADSPAALSALMGARGIIGRDIPNLVQIVDPGSAYEYDALDEYEGIDKVGASGATLLNGQVGMVKGVPLVVSDELEYADANGKVPEAHNGTKGQLVQVHRPGIKIGVSRNQMQDSLLVPWAGGTIWWNSIRLDIKQMESGHVAWGYNVSV